MQHRRAWPLSCDLTAMSIFAAWPATNWNPCCKYWFVDIVILKVLMCNRTGYPTVLKETISIDNRWKPSSQICNVWHRSLKMYADLLKSLERCRRFYVNPLRCDGYLGLLQLRSPHVGVPVLMRLVTRHPQLASRNCMLRVANQILAGGWVKFGTLTDFAVLLAHNSVKIDACLPYFADRSCAVVSRDTLVFLSCWFTTLAPNDPGGVLIAPISYGQHRERRRGQVSRRADRYRIRNAWWQRQRQNRQPRAKRWLLRVLLHAYIACKEAFSSGEFCLLKCPSNNL